MDIDYTQESRLMAREFPSDDPAWGQVSAFLTAVESTYSNAGATSLEASHLAAISRELRLLQAEPRPTQRKIMNSFLKLKTHRVLLGSLLSALVALTAGVGVAAAMGGDPLKQLVPASQPEVAPTPEESPTAPAVEATESEESQEAKDHSATADDEQENTDQSGRHESEGANDDSDDSNSDDSESDDSESDDSSEHAQPSHDSDDSDEADDDNHGNDQSGDQSVDDEPGEH